MDDAFWGVLNLSQIFPVGSGDRKNLQYQSDVWRTPAFHVFLSVALDLNIVSGNFCYSNLKLYSFVLILHLSNQIIVQQAHQKNPFVRLVAYSINVRFQAGGIGNIQTEIYRVLAWTGKINLFEPKRGLFEYRFPRGEINYTFMRPYFIYESLSAVFWSVKFSCQFVNNMHSLTLHLRHILYKIRP